jgi:hypothetical protein
MRSQNLVPNKVPLKGKPLQVLVSVNLPSFDIRSFECLIASRHIERRRIND